MKRWLPQPLFSLSLWGGLAAPRQYPGTGPDPPGAAARPVAAAVHRALLARPAAPAPAAEDPDLRPGAALGYHPGQSDSGAPDSRSDRKLRPLFIRLPLDLCNDFAIVVLTNTISLTPGTVSADLSPDRRSLLIHALDVEDVEQTVARIKSRYERPLQEIFEC